METLITEGIKVTVTPSYQAAYSRPAINRYIFAYHIIIENLGTETV
ncbi:MAG: Co2+/Mg2+ efflux protein ApaG, partial [Phaeodactylibacter sp.]|nr:Co2+/Mg2+ efflux protein ApaG [Phaeodactylibacter sp.]